MYKENFIITLEEQQIIKLVRMYTKESKDKNLFAERALHLTKFSDVLKDIGTALELLENLPVETENKRGDFMSAEGDIFPCWTIQAKKYSTTNVIKLYINLFDDEKLCVGIKRNFVDGIGALKFIAKTLSTKDNSEKREMRDKAYEIINYAEKLPTISYITPEKIKILKEHYTIWNNDLDAPLTTTYILPKFR